MEGRFVEEDVLYWRTFCMGGCFVEGRSLEGRYVEGRLVGRMFCSEGRFVEGRFVVVPNPQLHIQLILEQFLLFPQGWENFLYPFVQSFLLGFL